MHLYRTVLLDLESNLLHVWGCDNVYNSQEKQLCSFSFFGPITTQHFGFFH